MVDGDDTQEPADAVAALYHALLEMQAECDDLASALEQRDLTSIEAATSDLAAAWFAATAASKVLDVRATDARDHERVAMLALCVSHQVLFELFGRGLCQPSPEAEMPRLHGILRRLSARLGLAIAHDEAPPSHNTGSR